MVVAHDAEGLKNDGGVTVPASHPSHNPILLPKMLGTGPGLHSTPRDGLGGAADKEDLPERK
jgi:hypothetical protein